MFHELAINCRNFSFSKKGRSNCAGRRLSIRKGGEAMDALAGSVVTCAYDANGNITEYVNGGGEILSHSEYSSFGRELLHSGSDDFTHRFSTKSYCRKTGMLEFQLRRYRPRCGRWMNRDAIEEKGGLNLYGYVWNASIYKFDNITTNKKIYITGYRPYATTGSKTDEGVMYLKGGNVTLDLYLDNCEIYAQS
jgi:RHS repeat-associated protein